MSSGPPTMRAAITSRLNLRSGPVVLIALLASAAFAAPSSAAVTTKVIAETATPFAVAAPHWVAGDGRYVVYEDEGLYLADTVTGTSSFIAGAAESGPSISDDGRYVAYVDPTGGTSRARVWDRTTGNAELVSLTSDEQPMSAAPRGVTISGNGRYVAFLSQDADSLPPNWGLGNGVFLRDRTGGTTELISATPTHRAWEGEGPGLAPSLSDDGSVAAWSASLLSGPPFFPDPGAGGFGGTEGIVVWQRATGDLRLLEENYDRGEGVMLSGDGQSVVWNGCDPNPPNCDSPDRRDGLFVSDVETGTQEFIAPGWDATISDDGRYVAYGTRENENDDDVFRYDREANSPTQVNYNPDGSRAPARSLTGISGDGKNVGFLAGGAPQLLLAKFGEGIIRPTLDPQAPPKDAVWGWGYEGYGTLGMGGTDFRLLARELDVFAGATALAAGGRHSLAVKSDGTVWASGNNPDGRLGDGTTVQRNAPVRVSGLTGVAAVAAGSFHSLAVKSDGTVWAWGSNAQGQLGDGTTVQRTTPVRVSGLTDVVAVAAGSFYNLAVGRASPTHGVESFTQALPAGATVTTDVEQDGATPDDPLETTLRTPRAGTVSVAEKPSQGSVGGFSVYGRSVQITAPPASAADPLVIGFRLDATAYPPDWPLSSLLVSRNGSTVGDCGGSGASPDPCVESRTRLADGDVELVVRTSRASDWLIGRAGPAADAGGPYTVAEGSKITLNGSATGGEAPFTYQWSDAAGELDDPTKARPTFTGLDDATLALDLFVTDAADLAGQDDATVTVTNRPPSVSPLGVDADKKRRLDVAAAFADPGRLDTHTAIVRWGDGSQSAARVTERRGIGAAVADHQYAKKGTYTVKLTVRDDDGGETSVERRIEIR